MIKCDVLLATEKQKNKNQRVNTRTISTENEQANKIKFQLYYTVFS